MIRSRACTRVCLLLIECDLWCGITEDQLGLDLLAVSQDHTVGLAGGGGGDPLHWTVSEQLSSTGLSRAGDGSTDSSHPSLRVSPGPPHTLQLPHDVVQEDVARARSAGADHGSDTGVSCQGRL